MERVLVFVHKNRIIDALYGSASGEKALYRCSMAGASYSIESLENPQRSNAPSIFPPIP
jgi:hypothetical protein